MNMQISELMMSLPHNSQFILYRKLEETKIKVFSSKNVIHNRKPKLIINRCKTSITLVWTIADGPE